MKILISFLLGLCFLNSCNSKTSLNSTLGESKELEENKNTTTLSLQSNSEEKIYNNPVYENIQFKYGDLKYRDSINNISLWGSISIVLNGKSKKISSGDQNVFTDFQQIGWYSDNELFVYKVFHGEISDNLSETISEPYNSSNVFYDFEFNFHGEPLFTKDLDCYLAQNDRIRCFNKEYPDDDSELSLIKNLIFEDVAKIISSKSNIPNERLMRYKDIFENFDFKSSSYGVLFKYLFDINNKYSRTVQENEDYHLNKSLYSTIKSVNFLMLDNKPSIENYNNLSFYLEQAKAYEEAVFLLEKIVEEVPDRTVAFINLGDAYWGLDEKEKAKEAYKTYVDQMKTKGKEAKIPKRVLERLK